MGCACSDTVGSKRSNSQRRKRRRKGTTLIEESDSYVDVTDDEAEELDSAAERRAEAERMGYYYESDEDEEFDIPDLDDSDDEETSEKISSKGGESRVWSEEEILQGVKQAIEEGSVEMLEEWVDRSPLDLEFIVDASGHEIKVLNEMHPVGEISALMYSILLKRYDCESFLLSGVSDQQLTVNFHCSLSGDTALHWAVSKKSSSLIGLLLAKKADKQSLNDRGERPIDICVQMGDPWDIHKLLEPPDKMEVRDSMYVARSSALLGGLEDYQSLLQSKEVNKSTVAKKKADDSDVDAVGETALRTGPSSGTIGRSGHRLEAMESMETATPESIRATESIIDNLVETIAPKGSVEDEELCGLRSLTDFEKEDRLATILYERMHLPVKSGWLEKKTTGGFYKRRWAVCIDGYMCWSETKQEVQNVNDISERRRFEHHMYLLHLKSVSPIPTTAANKLQLVRILDPKKKKERNYVWKCADTRDRDGWVHALRAQQEFLKNMIQYLKSGTEYDVKKSAVDDLLSS